MALFLERSEAISILTPYGSHSQISPDLLPMLEDLKEDWEVFVVLNPLRESFYGE